MILTHGRESDFGARPKRLTFGDTRTQFLARNSTKRAPLNRYWSEP